MSEYRQLTEKEIATLTVYGCSAENWKNVVVSENFSPNYISNVHFSGNIKLGTYTKVFENEGGLKKHSGIFNTILHNCTVADDVYIDKVNNYIANYQIGKNVYIENVDKIVVNGSSSFGNGVKVATMIESGGREVSIFDNMSSQFAFMDVFYRQSTLLTEKLQTIIDNYVELKFSEIGTIDDNAEIINCGLIKNVRIGNSAKLHQVSVLENGSIISKKQAPVIVGAGVQCNDFIIQSGSSVVEAAMLTRCFVGQGCLIGKQFSAIDSLFFANCQGLHGEAVSIFAGPYTVSHHKSTLMLTALFSFMNAGSGTNFSNHMYKLGPIHQGITERGVKTSSDSYIMWPAKIGAFSVVLGRHKGNPDISDLPFSYLMENDAESNLLPGINLHSAGTIRDVMKWPKRDLRNDEIKLDSINFDFLSPYTISKAINGIALLKNLLQTMDEAATYVWFQNCKIKRSSIKKAIELYEMAVNKFIGYEVINRLKGQSIHTVTDISKLLSSNSKIGTGNWVDLAGLFAPKSEITKLMSQISDKIISLENIQFELSLIHEKYPLFSYNFALDLLEKRLSKTVSEFEVHDLIQVIENWKYAELTFADLVLRDAKKEFNTVSKTGFGLDGDDEVKNLDFEAVRATFESNAFVIEIQNELKQKSELALKLTNELNALK